MPAIIKVVDGRTIIKVGENSALAAASATLAEQYANDANLSADAAALAAAAVGVYTTVGSGEAATTNGQSFYVASGGAVTLYINNAGTGDEVASLTTAAALASTAPGEGAELVGIPVAGSVEKALLFGIDRITTTDIVASNVTGDLVHTSGYYVAGDGGGAEWRRVAVEPAHPGKMQDASGAWFELSYPEEGLDSRALGAVAGAGDGGATNLQKLQEVVDYVGSRPLGGTVLFDTSHSIAGTLALTNNIELRGSSLGELRQLADDTDLITGVNKSGCKLVGLTVWGKGSDYDGSGNPPRRGLLIQCDSPQTDWTVTGCQFHNFGGNPIRVSGAGGLTNIEISHNRFYGTFHYGGVKLGDGASQFAFVGGLVHALRFNDNYLRNVGGGPQIGKDSSDLEFHGNQIIGVREQHGFYIQTPNHVSVKNNTVRDVDLFSGIKFQFGDTTDVSEGSVTISGNNVSDVAGNGINFVNTGADPLVLAPNVIISSNVIRNAGSDGIDANHGKNVLITGNVVVGGRSGITLANMNNVEVHSNNIVEPGSNGVYLTEVNGGVSIDITISNNKIRHPGSLAISGQNNGIRIGGTAPGATSTISRIVVEGNDVADDTSVMRYGLYVARDIYQSSLSLCNNTLIGATDYGARFASNSIGLAKNDRNIFAGGTGQTLTMPVAYVQRGRMRQEFSCDAIPITPTGVQVIRGDIVWLTNPSTGEDVMMKVTAGGEIGNGAVLEAAA